ncbi:Peptidyl-prolyl cis-trans isomerase fpr2 [Gnomoniopsis smithogilvyi]|uniref:peptidylprolyl isomerase n=1 Tax=Gnomoniopsis smithogilvyi TaxID=1191159 RepID=A0A9W9CY49_9PEZI|nr:Peptidyl-prolyl cis-trans isomerase fpr2 [Gnomoniopsis smithogilvyi]
MQKILVTLSLLASAAVGVLAADELKIDVTLPVECERKTQNGDKVSMHYKGTLENGNKFDASYDRGTPFSFKIGSGQVIKGWDEGLLDMCIGEKRTLTIPPAKGYGQRAMGPIPAGSTLIFETELIGIDGVEAPASIVTKATPEATSTPPVEAATQNIVDTIKGKINEVAGLVKNLLTDQDGVEEKAEL